MIVGLTQMTGGDYTRVPEQSKAEFECLKLTVICGENSYVRRDANASDATENLYFAASDAPNSRKFEGKTTSRLYEFWLMIIIITIKIIIIDNNCDKRLWSL